MWNPPRGYKGQRTNYRHAFRVKLKNLPQWRGTDYYNRLMEMEDWCEANCRRNWSCSWIGEWWFDSRGEAVLFKLTFG